MLKGLRKVLSRSGKKQAQKPVSDVSHKSTTSAAASDLFACELGPEQEGAIWQDQHLTWHDLQAAWPGQVQVPAPAQQLQQQPLPAQAVSQQTPRLSAALIQQHLQQQLELHKLTADTADESMHRRQQAAMEKRMASAMLNPESCLHQINALLELSTAFEYRLSRDAMQALFQAPCSFAAAAGASSSRCEQHYSSTVLDRSGSTTSTSSCWDGSCCLVGRTLSTTAANTAHVALQLSRWGYRVIVRKVLHSKVYWTKSMHNTFIVALDTSNGSHVEYVLDPHFKEIFNTGVMSSNYSAVWHSLPQVFIGTPCQLQPVVQLLCEEMELSFLEAGRACPPWRSWSATINRWMSDQYVDILVPDATATDEEVAEYLTRCCQISTQGCGMGPAASGMSSSTTSTCSPLCNLQQQRLQDKLHVSSVLSSASTSSRRPVLEPAHKQLGFDTAMQDVGGPLSHFHDASSFTSTASGVVPPAQQLPAEDPAAAARFGVKLPVGACSLSEEPSAGCCSSSSCSSSARSSLQGTLVAYGDAEGAQGRPRTAGPQQQQMLCELSGPAAASTMHSGGGTAATQAAAAHAQAVQSQATGQQWSSAGQVGSTHSNCNTSNSIMEHRDCHGMKSSSNTSSRASSHSNTNKKAGRSLLTAHMQLTSQLQHQLQQQQQQQASRLSSVASGSSHIQLQPPQLQHMLHASQVAAQQQQQQLLAAAQAQQLVQLQLQLQQQQAQLQQQVALQHQRSQPQQPASSQKAPPSHVPLHQQQPSIAGLLPNIHTVRPVGPAAAGASQQLDLQQQQQQQRVHHSNVQQSAAGAAFVLAQLQQHQLHQQHHLRQPLLPLPSLQELQQAAPVQQQDQPRLLRLIHRLAK